ncbi:MAG TPA: hypothetical protein VGQ76_12915 [Thermoanaerobaculia bacterium]|nr:hypothetical protein [Thermoanaerobaculia bacterium]
MSATFTPEAAKAAQSLHNWTRFAALMMATAGAILLIATLVIAGAAASKYPAQRGLIAAAGTAYAIMSLAMLCFSFLLVRHGQKLETAAKQHRAAPLVEALPYETGIWAIAAGYVAVSLLSIALALMSPEARAFRPPPEVAQPAWQVRPVVVDSEERERADVVKKVNLISGALALGGLVLVIVALKPAVPA